MSESSAAKQTAAAAAAKEDKKTAKILAALTGHVAEIKIAVNNPTMDREQMRVAVRSMEILLKELASEDE